MRHMAMIVPRGLQELWVVMMPSTTGIDQHVVQKSGFPATGVAHSAHGIASTSIVIVMRSPGSTLPSRAVPPSPQRQGVRRTELLLTWRGASKPLFASVQR